MLGAIPNEYPHYYFNRDSVIAIRAAEETRGEHLRRAQTDFYREASARELSWPAEEPRRARFPGTSDARVEPHQRRFAGRF